MERRNDASTRLKSLSTKRKKIDQSLNSFLFGTYKDFRLPQKTNGQQTQP
jgi:hypothetical protein